MSVDAILAGARTLAATFPEVGASEAELISLLRTCALQAYAPDEPLCVEGDPSAQLYIVLEGSVSVARASDGPSTSILLQAPTLLGTMGIIDRSRRSATCTARGGPVLAATMDREVFRRVVRQTDGRGIALRRLMLTVLTRQLTEGNDRLRAVVAASEARAAHRTSHTTLRNAGR